MYNITGGNLLLDSRLILDKAKIKEGARVAELGCGGHGHFVFSSADRVGRSGTVYAIDILKNSLESLEKRARQENYKNIKTILSDLEIFGATKIESGSLDVALLINTLHMSVKRAEVVREAVRMLKRGGKLVVVEWKESSSPFGPDANQRVNKENLEKVMAKIGLRLEEDFPAGQYHYGLVFTKI
ncbi:MAG: methyltransferase domain-containing protein [bacterium]